MKGRNIKLLDETFFDQLHNTLDNRMKELSKMGCIKPHNQTHVITLEEEEMLWQAGILGSSAPKQLIETLLCMFGFHFALYLEYTEDSSKNNPGGIDHKKFGKKVMQAYKNKVLPQRYTVKLYKQYFFSASN